MVISFLYHTNAFALEPEVLLKSELDNARCFARCLSVMDSAEAKTCLDICKLVQVDPETDICKFPKFCTGACKIACGQQSQAQTPPSFSSYAASQCEVVWEVEKPMGQNVVFVVAGLDKGGMWHLVYDDLVVSRLALSSNSGTKYNKLQIIAVGENGGLDKIDISMIEDYGEECVKENIIGFTGKSFYMLFFITFSFLSLIVALLSFYLFRRSKSLKNSSTVFV